MSFPSITMIAAMDQQNGIGKDNQLLCYLPADLKHFKASTVGKPIIMGNNTFKSLGKPLPGRQNIVLSHQNKQESGVDYVKSIDEATAITQHSPEVMIIGGGRIYQLFMPKAQKLLITHIEACFSATVFFPDIDPAIWQITEETSVPADNQNAYSFRFCTYERRPTAH